MKHIQRDKNTKTILTWCIYTHYIKHLITNDHESIQIPLRHFVGYQRKIFQ